MNPQTFIKQVLIHNVPRFIKHIKDRGGVTEQEWHWLQCEEPSLDYPMELLLRADEYLLYPHGEKTQYKGLFVLVKTLAIMSFIPEGIRFFGLHFCSETENFIINDE